MKSKLRIVLALQAFDSYNGGDLVTCSAAQAQEFIARGMVRDLDVSSFESPDVTRLRSVVTLPGNMSAFAEKHPGLREHLATLLLRQASSFEVAEEVKPAGPPAVIIPDPPPGLEIDLAPEAPPAGSMTLDPQG